MCNQHRRELVGRHLRWWEREKCEGKDLGWGERVLGKDLGC